MWRRDIYLPAGWICECPFTAHCGCKCVHWAVPVPSKVTFASHIRSSCRLFRLWYLTCCEQNPVLRLVVYLWCELSSITGQACRQFLTKCNVYLQKGSNLPFFKYHRFVRPPRFSGPGCYQLPKIVAGTCWWLSWLCARAEISGCARAQHQPPGPLKQRQQATAYLERIHMKLPTSNCLQSIISICEFCKWFYAHNFNTKTPKRPPSPQNLPQGSLFPSYSSLWFECSCLTPTNNSPLLGFWPLIFVWDKCRWWWLLSSA